MPEQDSAIQKTNSAGALLKRPICYSEAAAQSLLLYTLSNSHFVEILETIISDLPNGQKTEILPEIEEGIEILYPLTYKSAVRRAKWLISGVAAGRLADLAASQLRAWAVAKNPEARRQLIVGVVGLAIPGLTLGLIKKRESMMYIVRRDLAINTKINWARQISGAGFEVFARALDMAEGEARALEPEIGDWFFGARDISFYAADGASLVNIKNTLRRFSIIHAAVEKNGELAALAISPAVNSFYSELRFTIEPLES